MKFVAEGIIRTSGSDEVKSHSEVTAVEMAKAEGVDPKKFRAALRRESFSWHSLGERWTVGRDSPEHRDMQTVMDRLLKSA